MSRASPRGGARRNSLSRRERIVLNIGISLCVYPSVLATRGVLQWLQLDLALWLKSCCPVP
jgi:hypothetical protein